MFRRNNRLADKKADNNIILTDDVQLSLSAFTGINIDKLFALNAYECVLNIRELPPVYDNKFDPEKHINYGKIEKQCVTVKQKGECGNLIMKNTLLIFIICQGVTAILDEAMKAQKIVFESNKEKLSPKEKLRYDNKIRLFNTFGKFLRYGTIIYLVLSIILEVMNIGSYE